MGSRLLPGDPGHPEIRRQPDDLGQRGHELVVVSETGTVMVFPDDLTVPGHLEGPARI